MCSQTVLTSELGEDWESDSAYTDGRTYGTVAVGTVGPVSGGTYPENFDWRACGVPDDTTEPVEGGGKHTS